jgi:hypothetical protein
MCGVFEEAWRRFFRENGKMILMNSRFLQKSSFNSWEEFIVNASLPFLFSFFEHPFLQI